MTATATAPTIDGHPAHHLEVLARDHGLPDGRVLYLAFGSNLDEDQMDRRCTGHAVFARVVLLGQRLAYGNRRHTATLVPDPGATAAAVIWEVGAADLARLDACEGVRSGAYERRRCRVGGHACHTYLIPRGAAEGAQPAEDYHGRIAKGLAVHGFMAHLARHRAAGHVGRAATPDPAAFDLAVVPGTNYRGHAVVEAGGAGAAAWLEEARVAVECGAAPFFFHGIFTKRATRERVGIPDPVLDARLANFRRHDDHGPSDVTHQPGAAAAGIVALVPDAGVVARLDEIEGAPDWYRREAVPLHVAGAATDLAVQFYLMNRGDGGGRRAPAAARAVSAG